MEAIYIPMISGDKLAREIGQKFHSEASNATEIGYMVIGSANTVNYSHMVHNALICYLPSSENCKDIYDEEEWFFYERVKEITGLDWGSLFLLRFEK